MIFPAYFALDKTQEEFASLRITVFHSWAITEDQSLFKNKVSEKGQFGKEVEWKRIVSRMVNRLQRKLNR